MSFDQVCLLMASSCSSTEEVPSRCPAHAIARHWKASSSALHVAGELGVVHADETSWSLNSVWAFLSEKARVMLFGTQRRRHAGEILDPATFAEY